MLLCNHKIGKGCLRCLNHSNCFILTYRFHPDEKAKRHPLVHIPFGWGPRNCIGLRFAMMEAKMALVSVLRKFRFERSPETEVRC